MSEGRHSALKPPRLVAWETTRACNLLCRHCRAEAIAEPPADELTHEEARQMLADIAAWPPSPMVILSGGEPLQRPDIVELARYGTSLGLRMLLSSNGTLLTPELAAAIKAAGVARVSLSLDGPDAASHDDFRGMPGAFEGVLRGAACLREAGLPFQINTTLSAANLHQAEIMTCLAEKLGAVAQHIFLLVPVGRAGNMTALSAEEYEAALINLKKRELSLPIEFKATCAPQYQRIGRQLSLAPAGPHGAGRGCLAGQGFMFVGSTGVCQGCGYLPLSAGTVREKSIVEIYQTSPLFEALRDQSAYRGKCGACEYWKLCGGCRARAHARGDYLGPEPLCPHEPQRTEAAPALDHIDRLILNAIQEKFPVTARPYEALAGRINAAHQVNLTGEELLARVKALKKNGYIRRLGAVFNARKLGYHSTLCAARVPEDTIEAVAALVSQSPRVTHNYLRSDELNLWFTFTSAEPEELPAFLEHLQAESGLAEIHILESEQLFKIKVGFQLRDE